MKLYIVGFQGSMVLNPEVLDLNSADAIHWGEYEGTVFIRAESSAEAEEKCLNMLEAAEHDFVDVSIKELIRL